MPCFVPSQWQLWPEPVSFGPSSTFSLLGTSTTTHTTQIPDHGSCCWHTVLLSDVAAGVLAPIRNPASSPERTRSCRPTRCTPISQCPCLRHSANPPLGRCPKNESEPGR